MEGAGVWLGVGAGCKAVGDGAVVGAGVVVGALVGGVLALGAGVFAPGSSPHAIETVETMANSRTAGRRLDMSSER